MQDWPREVWLAELDEHRNGRGEVVTPVHSTVARYEGCPKTDRDFHEYVDKHILDSTERYYKAKLAEARNAALEEASMMVAQICIGDLDAPAGSKDPLDVIAAIDALKTTNP